MAKSMTVVAGFIADEHRLSLRELAEVCGVVPETVYEMVEYGLLDPQGSGPEQWIFSGIAVRRICQAVRLSSDLEINMAGVALALDLLEEQEQLQARIRELEYRLSLLR